MSSIIQVSEQNGIVNNVHVDDWTAEWAIIAINGKKLNNLDFYFMIDLPFYRKIHPQSFQGLALRLKTSGSIAVQTRSGSRLGELRLNSKPYKNGTNYT